MITKSIRLSDHEAAIVREYVDLTGEVEASVLRRAMLRGLQDLKLEQAVTFYLRNGDSDEAAKVAGLPRAQFLNVLIDRGVTLLKGPSTVAEDVAFLAEALGNERLRSAAAAVASSSTDA